MHCVQDGLRLMHRIYIHVCWLLELVPLLMHGPRKLAFVFRTCDSAYV